MTKRHEGDHCECVGTVHDCCGTYCRPAERDDRERRDDHADQLFQVVASQANGITSLLNSLLAREQEQYTQRTEREREQYDRRQESINHQTSLERQGLTRAFEAGKVTTTALGLMAKEISDAAVDPDTPDVTDSPGAAQNA